MWRCISPRYSMWLWNAHMMQWLHSKCNLHKLLKCLESGGHFERHQTLGLIKHDCNTNNGGRETLFPTRTYTGENKIKLSRTGRAARKDESSLFVRLDESVSEKETIKKIQMQVLKSQSRPILSICFGTPHSLLHWRNGHGQGEPNITIWTGLRTVTHSRGTNTHARTHTVAKIFSEPMSRWTAQISQGLSEQQIARKFLSSLRFFLMGLCLEELRHSSPIIGHWFWSPREGSNLPQSLKSLQVSEESPVSSLRQPVSVHSWGEFDLMSSCSAAVLAIQAPAAGPAGEVFMFSFTFRRNLMNAGPPHFSNHHLVWYASNLPERPWVLRELRSEWVIIWQW